jgi:acyl-CoA thioesterase FadM
MMETPEIPPSPAMRFRVKLRTRWSDEDNQRVLNNAVYLTLFEETRFAYFTKLGLLSENQFPFLLSQTNVVFLAPGRGGAEIEVEAATIHLGTSSFTQAYRVRDVESGVVWCEAEARLVAWDNACGAKTKMSSAFRARLAEFEGLSTP